MINYKSELNAAQYKAVTEGDGYALVLAGAGSGKTRTITYRVAYLIEKKNVAPENILLLTFTNKAAAEMLKRVGALLVRQSAQGGAGAETQASIQKNAASKVMGGTFHSVALQILKQNPAALKNTLGFPENFSVLDSEDSVDMVKLVMEEVGITPGGGSKWGAAGAKSKKIPSARLVRDIISFSINSGRAIPEVVEERYENWEHLSDEIAGAANRYAERKRGAAVMDFDDLLWHLRGLLTNNTALQKAISSRLHYILVDEFQDTNRLQSEIVDLLGAVHKNIFVVGDDAQSIYSFRAADINNILDFPRRHKGTKIFKLEDNYRSTKPILDLANQIIRQNKGQFKKKLRPAHSGGQIPKLQTAGTQEEEAQFVAERISDLYKEGVPFKEMAVLFRAAHHSQVLEMELVRRGFKYDYRGGLKFFERAHIKDVLAFLRALHNFQDEIAWRRTLVLFEGIGPMTADTIFNKMRSFSSNENAAPAATAPETAASALAASFKEILPARAHTGIKKFFQVWGALQKAEKKPHALIEAVMSFAYKDYLEEKYEDTKARAADIEQLAAYARSSKRELGRFLAEASLHESYAAAHEKGGSGAKEDNDRIVLSTIHQAKGLEWDAVFIINLINGQFPNERALKEDGGLEEERRLFYVASTRARKHLFLTHPLLTAGGYAVNESSPFVADLDDGLVEKVEGADKEKMRYIKDIKEGEFLSSLEDL